MRSRMVMLFLSMVFLAACTGVPGAVTDPAPLSTIPNTDTLTAPPSESALPMGTPPPPGFAAYYRIRIEYSTTSDWSTLDLLTSEDILAMRVLAVIGEQVNPETNVNRLALNQSLENAQAGKGVSLKVDYGIAPEAVSQPLEFLLQKGALNGSTVRVYQIVDGEENLLQKIDHRGMVQHDPGMNPLSFSIDLSSLKETQPLLARVDSAGLPKMVWAFYYPWYHLEDWTYWLKDQPLVRYESGNRDVILHHVEQAQSAGIDGFISSWWGPGSETDKNLRKLLEIAEPMGFMVTIYFETMAGPDQTPLSADRIYEWLAYAIREYRDHPAFFKVDGEPLIVIWASNAVPLDTWAQTFDKLRADGLDAVYLAMGYNLSSLETFDGLHDYNAFTYPELEKTLRSTSRAVRNYVMLANDPTPKIWVATVQPGYDDTLQPTRQGQVKERENGNYYRFTWEAAIQSAPDWIFITSWNEWWEHTHIEPGELYGDLYLQITREYAELWKRE